MIPRWLTSRRWSVNPMVSKALALAVCGALFLGVNLLRTDVQPEDFTSNALDGGWQISLAALLDQGQISGRDFYFAYGPLAQIIAGLGRSINAGTALDGFFAIRLAFQSASILLLTLALSLIKRLNWKWVVIVMTGTMLLDALRDVASTRLLLLVLIAVMAARALAAATSARQIALAALTGGLCFAAELVTFDGGLLGLATALSVLGVYMLLARFPAILQAELLPTRRYLVMALAIVSVFGLANLALGIWFAATGPVGLFDFVFYNWEMVRGYNATFGLAWRVPAANLIGMALVGLYAAAAVLGQLHRTTVADGYVLISLLAASLFASKIMLVRSDWSHITKALIPLAGLVLMLGSYWAARPRGRIAWAAAVLLLFAAWPGVNFRLLTFTPILVGDREALPNQWRSVTTFRMPVDAVVPTGLEQQLPVGLRPLLAFPSHNQVAVGLRRPVLAPVMQALVAHTPALQRLYIERLEARSGEFDLVYALDDIASWAVDGVQHITRLPIIFQYLAEHFELSSAEPQASGYYVLRPRAQPAPLRATDLSFQVSRVGSQLEVQLAQPTDCSLLQLNVKISYPFYAWLGRPNILDATVFSAGREVARTGLVAVDTGATFNTYISLIDSARFYEVFGAGPVQTKSWDLLTMRPRPTGAFEVSPSEIDIRQVACIRF